MDWFKWLHLVGLLIYGGGILTLSRMLAKVVRYETEASRADSYRALKRMHKFVDWGGAGLLLVTGLYMLIADPAGKHYMTKPYFHVKLTCVFVLLVSDVLLSRKLFALRPDGAQPGPNYFRAVHGLIGLALIGALAAIFILRG